MDWFIAVATANLVTACTAIKANLGITFFAYVFAILGGMWSVIWSLAFVGVYDQTYKCEDPTETEGQTTQTTPTCTPNYFFVFLLFLSFFFVQQVLQVRFYRFTRCSLTSYSCFAVRPIELHPCPSRWNCGQLV